MPGQTPNISSSASAKSGNELSLNQGPVSFGAVTGPTFNARSKTTPWIIGGLILVALFAVVYIFKKK